MLSQMKINDEKFTEFVFEDFLKADKQDASDKLSDLTISNEQGVLEKLDSEKDVNEEKLRTLSEEELLNLKKFLFEERIRILQEKDQQQALYDKFIKERIAFQEEMKALNSKVLSERKRLKEENAFFDKKMQILQNGFLQLDLDRKSFEKEKKRFEQRKYYSEDRSYGSSSYSYCSIQTPDFFRGVNNILGLKKRYRDLLKIFHPDNLCGDNDTVLEITRQYEAISSKM